NEIFLVREAEDLFPGDVSFFGPVVGGRRRRNLSTYCARAAEAPCGTSRNDGKQVAAANVRTHRNWPPLELDTAVRLWFPCGVYRLRGRGHRRGRRDRRVVRDAGRHERQGNYRQAGAGGQRGM